MDDHLTIEKLKKRIQELEPAELETQRLKAALEDCQEKYRLIVENTAEIIAILDMDLRFTSISPAIKKIRGYTSEEIMAQSLEEGLTRESMALATNVFLEELQMEASGTADPDRVRILELEEYHKDGSTVWMEVSLSFLRDRNGKASGILALSRDISKRKQAERELQMFREVVDKSSNVIGISTPEGKHFYQNEAFENLFGSIGDDPSSVFVDKTVADEVFNAIKAGKLWDGEVKMIARDRSVRDIQMRAYAIKAPNGRVTELVGIHTDITEQKRAEAESSRLASVVRHSRELVNLATPDGRMVFLNDAGKKMLGISEEDVQQTNIMQVIPGYLRKKIEQEVLLFIRKEGYWEGDIQYRNLKTGALTDVHTVCFEISDSETSSVKLLANVSQDITEQKRAEEALKQSEERFRIIFDEAPIGIVLTDSQTGKIYEANSAFAKITGRSLDQLKKTDWMSIAHPDDIPDAVEKITDMVAGKTPGFQSEKRILRSDGSVALINLTVSHLKVDSHLLPLHLGMIEDITERRQAAEERAKLEGQFHQAQKMESVGRLAGGVAHDFNNMLSVILGFTELAMAKVDPSLPLYGDLAEIRQAASRSAGLTRQLLAFARKQTIAPKVLDINETVSGMTNMLRRLIGEDINLEWRPEPHPWPVMADPSQIDQILANLCVNARDAIHDVGLITIETKNIAIEKAFCADKPEFVPGEYLRLSVSDTGNGMDKDTFMQIFEPFFTTKAMGKGTGLGLATVYGIVKQNNGFIDVESEPGRGTTFSVICPGMK